MATVGRSPGGGTTPSLRVRTRPGAPEEVASAIGSRRAMPPGLEGPVEGRGCPAILSRRVRITRRRPGPTEGRSPLLDARPPLPPCLPVEARPAEPDAAARERRRLEAADVAPADRCRDPPQPVRVDHRRQRRPGPPIAPHGRSVAGAAEVAGLTRRPQLAKVRGPEAAGGAGLLRRLVHGGEGAEVETPAPISVMQPWCTVWCKA